MASLPHGTLVLVTGATGYIGGRLVPRLLEQGFRVRVLVRTPAKLVGIPWRADVEVVQGDLTSTADTKRAFADVHTLFYLVHSMGSGSRFEANELETARLVVDCAAAADVTKIVYLGGLHPDDVALSPHMRSRTAVGQTLLDGPVPALVLQAGVVIGSGSASFEMIRHLSENLPLMPAPSWVLNHIEPIAIRDVLHYLVNAPAVSPDVNRAFDIGSREVLTYAALMYGYAREAGLPHRRIYALPIPAPRLAGWWVALVTPIPHSMAVPLVQSLQHDAVAREREIDTIIGPPASGLTDYRTAVRLALSRIEDGTVETSWSSASDSRPYEALPSDPEWAGRVVYVDERTRHAAVAPAAVWQVIEEIGGENGWYSVPAAWLIRGLADKILGGVGHNRGRRSATRLVVGDAVDWWRVEYIEPGRTLRLRAEMRMPGAAWLELTATPQGDGTTYHQRAIFLPRGLVGKLYWWLVVPFHGVIFPLMARNILQRASLS